MQIGLHRLPTLREQPVPEEGEWRRVSRRDVPQRAVHANLRPQLPPRIEFGGRDLRVVLLWLLPPI